MHDRRTRQALRLALCDPEEIVNPDVTCSGNRTHIVWDSTHDVCTYAIEQPLNRHFQAQQDTFPSGPVELLLRALIESGSGQGPRQGISDRALSRFLKRLDPLLTEWTQLGRGVVETLVANALSTAVVSAFEATVNEWCQVFDLDFEPTPEMTAGLGNWAKRRAAELVAGIEEVTSNQVADIITDGLEKGLSASEIVAKVREYLRDSSRIADRAETIALTETSEALNRSVLDANRLLGATEKHWRCCQDFRVCMPCWKNDDEGPIPIEEAFLSGHRRPPAHPRCRCIVLYFGVTRESLVQALGLA
jgi:hypothetical protein